MLKENTLEGSEPRRVEMFHDFDYSGGIVAGKAGVLIHKRTLKQLDAFAFTRRQRIEAKALSGSFQNARRYIDSRDL
jgi:hypothetical protein